MVTKSKDVCAVNLIPAYIDGELEDDARVLFEQHVEVCGDCRAELTAHRLFICELDAAMTQSLDVAMPDDFSRIVAARAESDMSGVRSFAEHRKALSICAILAFVAFALLGTAARTASWVRCSASMGVRSAPRRSGSSTGSSESGSATGPISSEAMRPSERPSRFSE